MGKGNKAKRKTGQDRGKARQSEMNSNMSTDGAYFWDFGQIVKEGCKTASSLFSTTVKKLSISVNNKINDLSDSVKSKGMDTALTLASKISEQKTEEGLLTFLIENAEKFADDPAAIGCLANKINGFKSEELINQTLQVFDIALCGPKSLKCSNVIVHSKFFKERTIDEKYRLPDEKLLDVLCKVANNVEKHSTINLSHKQEANLKERVESIIAGNEIGFIRYASQNQQENNIVVSILSVACSRVASNPRSAYSKFKEIGSLLTRILWKYEKDEIICEPCLIALTELTFIGKEGQYTNISTDIISQINRYAGCIVKVMRCHIKSLALLRIGFKVIANIACDKKAVDHIMKNDVIGLVRDAPDDDFGERGTYKYWRARALWELSKNPLSRIELGRDAKIVGTMIEALKENWKDTKFAYPCCAFLDSIEMNDLIVKSFSGGEVVVLKNMMERHKDDSYLVKAARSLIEKLKPLISDESDVPQQTTDKTLSTSNGVLRSSSGSDLTRSQSASRLSRLHSENNDNSTARQSCILCYGRTEPDFYLPFVESLKEAEFKNTDSMVKYSREIASYLNRKGVLKEYGMSEADAMSIATYTFDNGSEQFEENPYRIINKTIVQRNTADTLRLRGYILHLLVALRKLKHYEGKGPLYRAVTGKLNPMCTIPESELTWSAFTSTSSDENSVIDFFNTAVIMGPKYIFEIRGCFNNGYGISEFSFHPDEEEILFEPETKFIVKDVKSDPKVLGCTRIFVEILETPPVLKEVVGRFRTMCKKNADKENFSWAAKEAIACPVFLGPVVPASGWRDIWSGMTKCFERYFRLKETLMFMGEEGMKELLLGFKKLAVDDEYGEAAGMMKGYKLSLEEGAALYSYSYKYGEEKTPSWALNNMFRGGDSFPPEGFFYLLHILNALQKLPEWGHSYNDDSNNSSDDDESGNDDDDDDDYDDDDDDDDNADDDKMLYVVISKKDGWEPVERNLYFLKGILVGKTERPVWKEDEFLLCIKKPLNLHGREVGPLTMWGSTGYILAGPWCRIAVESVETNEGGVFVVTATAVDISLEGMNEIGGCLKRFASCAPLPDGWSIEEDEDSGRIFYQNDETDQTQWLRPEVEDPGFFEDFKVNKSEQQQQPQQPPLSQPSSGAEQQQGHTYPQVQANYPQPPQQQPQPQSQQAQTQYSQPSCPSPSLPYQAQPPCPPAFSASQPQPPQQYPYQHQQQQQCFIYPQPPVQYPPPRQASSLLPYQPQFSPVSSYQLPQPAFSASQPQPPQQYSYQHQQQQQCFIYPQPSVQYPPPRQASPLLPYQPQFSCPPPPQTSFSVPQPQTQQLPCQYQQPMGNYPTQ